MKLTVRAEVMGGAILQQVFIVEYTIANQMCDDCHRSEAQDYWRALVIFLLPLYSMFYFFKNSPIIDNAEYCRFKFARKQKTKNHSIIWNN